MAKTGAASHQTPVVLAVGSGLIRDSIKAALTDSEDLTVIRETWDPKEIQGVLEGEEGQVVLLGWSLAEELFAKTSLAGKQKTVVVIVPANTPADAVMRFLGLGCKAVVTIDIRMADLARVLHLAVKDLAVFPANALVSANAPARFLKTRGAAVPALSPKEQRLLELLAQGMTAREVCASLGVGLRTMHTHLDRMRRKLGARNRMHAVALATAHGLVSPLMPRTIAP